MARRTSSADHCAVSVAQATVAFRQARGSPVQPPVFVPTSCLLTLDVTALVPSPSFIRNWRKLDILPVIPVFNIASALGVPFVDKVRAHAPLHHSRVHSPHASGESAASAPEGVGGPCFLAVPACMPTATCASVSLDSSRAFGSGPCGGCRCIYRSWSDGR